MSRASGFVMAQPRTDGVATIRPAVAADAAVLVAGRDELSKRFLGDEDPDPRPVACIEVTDRVVGWVDYDHDRPWLADDEVNLGYGLFPEHRGRGYATRAVRLLVEHLTEDTDWKTASLLINARNERSLALAARAGFDRVDDLDGHPYWRLDLVG